MNFLLLLSLKAYLKQRSKEIAQRGKNMTKDLTALRRSFRPVSKELTERETQTTADWAVLARAQVKISVLKMADGL
jgi:hypothetical protein